MSASVLHHHFNKYLCGALYNVVCFPFSDIEVPRSSVDDIQGDHEESEVGDGTVESEKTGQLEDSPEDTAQQSPSKPAEGEPVGDSDADDNEGKINTHHFTLCLFCMGSYSHNILNNTNDSTVIFEILDTVHVIQLIESYIHRSNI
mgnify:CR=1 FL=1